MKNILIVLVLGISSFTTLSAQYEKSGVGFEVGYGRFQGEFSKYVPSSFSFGIDIRQEIKHHLKIGISYQSGIASMKNSNWSSSKWGFNTGELKLWYHKKSIDDYYSPKGKDFNPFVGLSIGAGTIQEPNIELVDGSKRFNPIAGFELGTEYSKYTFTYRMRYFGNTSANPINFLDTSNMLALSHNLIIAIRFRTAYSFKDFARELF